jgi:hypothetical protein
MISVAVNGREVIIRDDFQQAIDRYARSNFKLGAAKKKDADKLPELHREDQAAWRAIYTELATVLADFQYDLQREPSMKPEPYVGEPGWQGK